MVPVAKLTGNKKLYFKYPIVLLSLTYSDVVPALKMRQTLCDKRRFLRFVQFDLLIGWKNYTLESAIEFASSFIRLPTL